MILLCFSVGTENGFIEKSKEIRVTRVESVQLYVELTEE